MSTAGKSVVQGELETILDCPESLTGLYLSGRREILLPEQRRASNGKFISITGARENNLNNIDVDIPLGVFICITGASGSGKSTLINEILYKRLHSIYHDSRTLYGNHDELDGHQHIDDVISIDQSPIGRSSRSNPLPISNSTTISANSLPAHRSQSQGTTPPHDSVSTSKVDGVKSATVKAPSQRSSILCRMSRSFVRPVKAHATTKIRLMPPITVRISPRSLICLLRKAFRVLRRSTAD